MHTLIGRYRNLYWQFAEVKLKYITLKEWQNHLLEINTEQNLEATARKILTDAPMSSPFWKSGLGDLYVNLQGLLEDMSIRKSLWLVHYGYGDTEDAAKLKDLTSALDYITNTDAHKIDHVGVEDHVEVILNLLQDYVNITAMEYMGRCTHSDGE